MTEATDDEKKRAARIASLASRTNTHAVDPDALRHGHVGLHGSASRAGSWTGIGRPCGTLFRSRAHSGQVLPECARSRQAKPCGRGERPHPVRERSQGRGAAPLAGGFRREARIFTRSDGNR